MGVGRCSCPLAACRRMLCACWHSSALLLHRRRHQQQRSADVAPEESVVGRPHTSGPVIPTGMLAPLRKGAPAAASTTSHLQGRRGEAAPHAMRVFFLQNVAASQLLAPAQVVPRARHPRTQGRAGNTCGCAAGRRPAPARSLVPAGNIELVAAVQEVQPLHAHKMFLPRGAAPAAAAAIVSGSWAGAAVGWRGRGRLEELRGGSVVRAAGGAHR